MKTSEAQKYVEVIRIKKYWREIDPLAYAYIVLELCCDSFRPCPPYYPYALTLYAYLLNAYLLNAFLQSALLQLIRLES